MSNRPDILVSVNPTFFCKKLCGYCYLGDLRNDKTILNESVLSQKLSQIAQNYNISHIDVYGGNLEELPHEYLSTIFKVCKSYCNNITAISDAFEYLLQLKQQYNFNIATSCNLERHYNTNLDNSDIIIYTVLPSMLNIDAQEFLKNQDHTISFNQYYDAKNSKVHYKISNKQYSDFLIKILNAYDPKIHKFKILNIYSLEQALNNKANVFADSHVFIMPNGKFAQTKYVNNLEEFEYFDDISYLNLIKKQEQIKFQYGKCALCKYNMQCMAEHLHDWDNNDECCGMKAVLNWYNIHRCKFYGKPTAI